ncbi:MAG: hypothetical protein ACYT04_14340 [Nostoc sp.]
MHNYLFRFYACVEVDPNVVFRNPVSRNPRATTTGSGCADNQRANVGNALDSLSSCLFCCLQQNKTFILNN